MQSRAIVLRLLEQMLAAMQEAETSVGFVMSTASRLGERLVPNIAVILSAVVAEEVADSNPVTPTRPEANRPTSERREFAVQAVIDRITRAVGLVLVTLPKTIAVGLIMLPMIVAFYIKRLLGREAEPIAIEVAVEREDQVKPARLRGPFKITYAVQDPEQRETQEARYWFQVCAMLVLFLYAFVKLLPGLNQLVRAWFGW